MMTDAPLNLKEAPLREKCKCDCPPGPVGPAGPAGPMGPQGPAGPASSGDASIFTLRLQTRIQIDQLLLGRHYPERNWLRFNPGSETRNPNCWIFPLDFSGLDTTGKVSLVTKRHAITAAHALPSSNTDLVFVDRDGFPYARRVTASAIYSGSDLAVVTLDGDAPDTVTPFQLLPANYADWFENQSMGLGSNEIPVEVIWFRPNSGKVNVKAVIYEYFALSNGQFLIQLNGTGVEFGGQTWNPPLLTEGNPTAQDSGGAVFILVNGTPVFLFATFASPGPIGPQTSRPEHLAFIRQVCGEDYSIKLADLSRYPKLY